MRRKIELDTPITARDGVVVTLHRPWKCGYQATASDDRGNVAVARGDFGAGYPTVALARRAVRRVLKSMQTDNR